MDRTYANCFKYELQFKYLYISYISYKTLNKQLISYYNKMGKQNKYTKFYLILFL